jgi:hypothetical protein
LAEDCRVSIVCASAVPVVRAKSTPQLIERFNMIGLPSGVEVRNFVAAILPDC